MNKHSTGPKPSNIPIKVYSFVSDDQIVFVTNGVDHLVRLDGTNKEATHNVKQPKAVFVTNVKGVTYNLRRLRRIGSNE